MVLSAVYQQPTKTQYQGDITTKAEGSISPLTAPIQQVGKTYTLTSSVEGGITIERDNIVLNGNGYKIIDQEYTGTSELSLNKVSNVKIENLIIPAEKYEAANSAETTGISLTNSSNVTVFNNTVSRITIAGVVLVVLVFADLLVYFKERKPAPRHMTKGGIA